MAFAINAFTHYPWSLVPMESQNKSMKVVGMVDIKEGWCIEIVEGGLRGI